MGLSSTLLVVALLTGFVPAMALRLRPPTRFTGVAASLLVAVLTALAGYRVAQRLHPVGVFELAHLAYLLVVVSVPLLLGIWFVSAVLRGQRSRRMDVVGGLALVIAVLGVWGTHIEPNWLRTDRVTIAAPVDAPLRVGVLADLQTPNVGRLEWDAINTLIEEKPDMVVVPGDLYQGSFATIQESSDDFSALLAALVAEIDVVAVVSGDHDRGGQLEPIVRAAGALYLDNAIVHVDVAGEQVRLAGVAVFHSPERAATMDALTDPSDDFTVLVSHRPGITYALPADADIDLIVAGHTHGAQLNLPVISDRIWYSDVPARAANGGVSRINDFLLYVSTGVGMERHGAPQVRFGRRPEVSVVTVIPE